MHAMRVGSSLVSTLLLGASAVAQPLPAPDNFGTEDGIDLWIPASEFSGAGVDLWFPPFRLGYWVLGDENIASLYAHVPLPHGAFLDGFRVLYSDGSADQGFEIHLQKVRDDSFDPGNEEIDVLASHESAGTPGHETVFVPVNHTIDLRESGNNAADFYRFVIVVYEHISFKGVRLFWRRQVSPAPQTATFADVPTSHPFFQFIEALARSGITAGCGDDNFCPDNPLTRGQMAVFLAKALGLHWTP